MVVEVFSPASSLNYLADMVSIGTLVAFIVVSVGVVILRVRRPDLPRSSGALYPVTPVLSVLACGYILFSLHWYVVGVLRMGRGGAGVPTSFGVAITAR